MVAEVEDGRDHESPTEVAYLRTFSGELSPALLRLVAALNGFTPPPARDFEYCELGAGYGDTLTALAAANPTARFVGVDHNPEHVAFARGLARRGELTNVRFLERDFENLHQEELPSFDFIAAHGVLSWISPVTRRALLGFARARLKPGGLLYVSYNALPGWAALEPLRRLIQDGAASAGGATLEGARRGVALARVLCDAGALYFTSNPTARAMLDTMTTTGMHYVVHEYLTPHWHPRYFADVAREMAAEDLYFIGQLPLYMNYRDLSIPPPLLEVMKGVTDRGSFESFKDVALNELFRRDVFIKGVQPCSGENTRDYLESTAFGALVSEREIQREARLSHYALRFAGPIFDALIPAIARGAHPIPDLARRPELAAFGLPQIRESLRNLVLGGQVVPLPGPPAPDVAPRGGPYRIALAYNRMILEQRLNRDTPIVLASPVAGTGLLVSAVEAVSMRLLTEIEPAQRSAWIRAFVARQPLRLRVADRPVDGEDEQARVIADAFDGFCERRLPKLLELGILEPAG